MDSCMYQRYKENSYIREFLYILIQHRYFIVLCVISFGMISAYIAYFKSNMYESTAVIEVGSYVNRNGEENTFCKIMQSQAMNIDTETGIIQSRFLAKKALESVDFSHRYFTTRKFKKIELYTQVPFHVGMSRGYDVIFELYRIDKQHYRLVVDEAIDKNGNAWSYDKIHLYGEEVVTKHFHLNIIRVAKFVDEEYTFFIAKKNTPLEGVNVFPSTKYSHLLKISYKDNVPLRAQEYTNALAHAYIQQNIERKSKAVTLKLDFVNEELKKIKENLKSSAMKIESVKRVLSTTNINVKTESIMKQINVFVVKLENRVMQQKILDKLYNQVKKRKHLENVSLIGIEGLNQTLAKQISMLQDTILQKEILREDYTAMYPDVVKLSKQIKYLKKNIIETIKNLKESIHEQIESLEQSIVKYKKKLNLIPADEKIFGQLQRKFILNEKIYTTLVEKQIELAMAKASIVSENRIIDEAVYPNIPLDEHRTLVILFGLILGFIFGGVIAIIYSLTNNTIQRIEDISRMIDVPLLGTIPHIKHNEDLLSVLSSSKTLISEAFRSLRINLEFMTHRGKAHVIAVTSTVGMEGKTMLCANLSTVMSRANKKTVVLSLDMRKPTLHERFNLSNQQGMSTLLSENTTLSNVIQNTNYENLDVITSGPIPPNPSELIQRDLMKKVLEKLAEVYDVIILDTPAVGLVSDAKPLMPLVDTNIYVLRAGYSQKRYIYQLKDMLSLQKIEGLAIVLNDVDINKEQ